VIDGGSGSNLSILTYPLTLAFIPPFVLLLHVNDYDYSSKSVSVWQIIKERLVPFCVAVAAVREYNGS
jgi:hypothetical protein